MPSGPVRLLTAAVALTAALRPAAAQEPAAAAVELGLVPAAHAPDAGCWDPPRDRPAPHNLAVFLTGGTEAGVRFQYTAWSSGRHAWVVEANAAIPLFIPLGFIPTAGVRYRYTCFDGPLAAAFIAPGVRGGGMIVGLPIVGVAGAPGVAADVTFSCLHKDTHWESGIDLGAAWLFARHREPFILPVATLFTGFHF
jgi:hypothetical protein